MERSLQTLSPNLRQHFEQIGVRLGDSCHINPVWGKRKEMKLKHTELYFADSCYNFGVKKCIILPSENKESFKLVLKMSQSNKFEQKSERFILRSLTENPFWINGNWCYESFIERGDKVKIGNNFLEFKKDKAVEMVKTLFIDDLNIDKNLIRSAVNILLEGETGTGKTYWAKKIHDLSGVRGNFVHINLSSYPKELIESELFGHQKGSFTGAVNSKEGAFSLAHKGTLFLDEIDSLSKDIQTKLLLFLDSGKFRIVGSNKETKVKTRLIFASGKNLEKLVHQKNIREDFYYRLSSGFSYYLKPIRDRADFIQKFVELYAIKNKISVAPDLVDFYVSLPWPGNIRQLEGHLNKKRIVSQNNKFFFDNHDKRLIVQSSDLMNIDNGDYTLAEVEKIYTQKIFEESGKNINLSSKKLEISRQKLKRILEVA